MANDEFKLGVGQAHEFEIAARLAGWTNAEFARMTQDAKKLKQVLAVIRGTAEIKSITHLIDLNADPFIPCGLTIRREDQLKEVTCGQLAFSADTLALFLTKTQMVRAVSGHDILKEIEGQPALNANALDFLLEHQELIPKELKGMKIFFWGTIFYSNQAEVRVVRYLYWNGLCWNAGAGTLEAAFNSNMPTAIIAS